MNDMIRQLATFAPALVAQLKGNPDALAEFTRGYQTTLEQQQQMRLREQAASLAMGDRETQQADRDRMLARQAEQDTIAGEERNYGKYQDALRMLGQLVPAQETVEGAESMSQGVLAGVPPSVREMVAPMADAQLRQVPQMITGRQKKAVEAYVEAALKTSFVADNPDHDPELAQLPEHIAKIIGKPSAKLSELQQFAQLPVGKPAGKPSDTASMQGKEVLVNGKLVLANYNPKTGTYTDQSGQPVVADAVPPKPTAGSDPEVAELRKELLRLQVERAGEPKPPKEPNQAQFTSAGYAGRMEQAEPILQKVEPSIVAMGLPKFELQTNSWFAKPTFQSPEVQSYMQAARNFINAVLRRESGAVISPEEFAEARKQYLPIAGDTPEALANKAANRAYVFQTMKRSSGAAYEPPVAAPTGGPKLKERRKFGDVLGEWNGKEWVEVKP